MVGLEGVAPQGIGLDAADDAIHHGHGLGRIVTGCTFRRQHDGIGALVDGRGHVRGFGARRGRRVDHGLKHLGGDDHRLSGLPATVDDGTLQDGHVLGRHFDAQIAARHHDGVGQLDDLVQVPDCRRFLQLDQDPGPSGDQVTGLAHVFGKLHERQRDPVDAEAESVYQVIPVLGGDR